MKLEYLGKTVYRKQNLMQGFYIGIKADLEMLKESKKKIVLFGGTGDNGFFAETLLAQKGVNVYGYADNSAKLQGKTLRGKIIYSPYEIINNDEFFVIIATSNSNINYMRLQLLAHGMKDYGIFLETMHHDFQEENEELQERLMNAINILCFEGEDEESALPHVGIAIGGDGAKLGDVNWLLMSTIWSHWAYLWIEEILEKEKKKKILEVGPGFGLMSLVFLEKYKEIQIDWAIYGESSNSLEAMPGKGYAKGLKKIKKQYEQQIKERWGQIELDNLTLEQQKYELIIMTEVFEHFVLNPVSTLRKLVDALREDGYLILTTPNWGHVHIYNSWKDMPEKEAISEEEYFSLAKCGHTYQYTKDELEEIIRRANLKVVRYELSDSNNHNYILQKLS